MFGSLISATDPVAVIALFKELGAPKQLTILVEGESLFNDATAIVAFNIILATVTAGQIGEGAIQQGTISFLVSFIGGIAVGAVFGLIMSWTMNLSQENSLILATITTISAYGAFLIAEEVFTVSPVMAVVSAGLVIGWHKSNRLDAEEREYLGEFWEYAAFLANSLIFLLVGITASSFRFFEQLEETQSLLTILGITIVTVLIARAIVVFTLVPLVNLFRDSKIPFSYQAVSYWGGLRGAVCLALALSIDKEFPNRDLIVMLTLGVALFTLLIPGTTIGKLIQKFQLNRPSVLDSFGQALAILRAKQEALKEANNLQADDYFLPNVASDFAQQCKLEVEQAQDALTKLRQELNLNEAEIEQLVWSEAIAIEHQVYQELQDRGFISETVLAQLTLMMNLKSDAVQAGNIPPELPEVKPLEVRINNLLTNLFKNDAWIEQIKADLIATEYEYLTFLAYGCEQVSNKLRSLIADTGIPEASIASCVNHYNRVRQSKIEEAQLVVQKSPEKAIAFQTKILSRVNLVVQNNTVEELVEQGAIAQSVAERVIQQINNK